jgi:hypothetical protein
MYLNLHPTEREDWYYWGQEYAKTGAGCPPTHPSWFFYAGEDRAEALECWDAGFADYTIRTANGKPVDEPNPGDGLQEETVDNDTGMYVSGGVGDVNSTERGSGARFNAGKPKLEYIPMRVLLDIMAQETVGYEGKADLLAIGSAVAAFEEGDDKGAARALLLLTERFGVESTCAQFDFGAKKYAAWNWAKGMAWSIPLACIKRHWLKLRSGEQDDPESGVSHWGAIGDNLTMLVHFVRHYREGDDRPPAYIFGGK